MHQQHHYYVLGKVGKALQKPSLTFIKWRLRGRQACFATSNLAEEGGGQWAHQVVFFKDPAGTYILSNNNNNKLDWLTVCIHNLCFEERATTEKKNKNITTPFFQIYVTTQQPPNQDWWVENLDDDDDDDDDDGGAFGEVKAPQGIWNTQGSNV